jgi:hypothetical protein
MLLGLTFAAALVLNLYPVLRPVLYGDDFEILVRSWTWERTQATFWEPQNEHAMPLGRLSTRALVLLAGRPTWLPLAAELQGIVAHLAAMGLLYLFVSRELGQPLYGIVAIGIFGVTSLYQQAIYWFAASFSVLALCTLLLALLAAQRWRQSGHWPWLLLCMVGSALAPAWFASGVLAGPLCCLYLLPFGREPWTGTRWRFTAERVVLALLPLGGTAAFLAVSLPRTAEYIMHLEHYAGRPATEAFDLRVGAWYTSRSLVDNLTLGQLGVSGVRCPTWLIPLGLLLLGAAAFWWWRRAKYRGLLVLGLGFIFSSYLLVYGARAGWDYDDYDFTSATWARYHLLPQLGLALFVCGGLPEFVHVGPTISRLQFRRIAMLLALLVIIHAPRVVAQHWYRDPTEQQAALRLIEETDARCQAHGIDVATAREALGWWTLPHSSSKENGWEFLRGSAAPRPMTVEEARRLLQE